MNKRYFGRFLPLLLSLELIVAPTLPHFKLQAQTNNNNLRALGRGVLNEMNNFLQTNFPGSSPQTVKDFAALIEQQKPELDGRFNRDVLLRIPGLAKYMDDYKIPIESINCYTLKTTMYEAKSQVCEIGVVNTGVPPAQQMQEMYAYYNQYFQINKLYRNYTVDSNVGGQLFGVGCMKNAMDILNGFFKHRTEQLDRALTEMKSQVDLFKKQSRVDLDVIEEAVASLDGSNADESILNAVRTRKPDLLNYKQNLNSTACNSIYSGNQLTTLGQRTGLNGISQDLTGKFTDKKGLYSGENYAGFHAAIISDINKLAGKVSNQFQNNFSSISNDPQGQGFNKFISGIRGQVSSPYKTHESINLDSLSESQEKFNSQLRVLSEEQQTIFSELGATQIPSDDVSKLLTNNLSNNFDTEVNTLETRIKNKCLNSAIRAINLEKLLSKVRNPNRSGFANKNASNSLKTKIKEIFSNPNTSLEKKLSELKSEDNGKDIIEPDAPYELMDVDSTGNLRRKKIRPKPIRPVEFFSGIVRNCNAQFKANKLNNKLTGAEAIKRLRTLKSSFKKLQEEQKNNIKNELVKKLVSCESETIANNTTPGSCTSELFNTTKPGFCANAALSCSKNMQACVEETNNHVKKIKDEKFARTLRYKLQMKDTKDKIVKIFDNKLAQFMAEGEALRSLFGAGFVSPDGIKREVDKGQRFLSEFQKGTSATQLEDPDQFVKMFQENIVKLKTSIQAQQKQILGGDKIGSGLNSGVLSEHIKNTEKNYEKVIQESEKFYTQCDSKYKESMAAAKAAQEQEMKKMTELGEKRGTWCNKFNLASSNPKAACSGNEQDTMEALKTVNTPDARQAIADFSNYCSFYGNEKDEGIDFATACYEAGKSGYENVILKCNSAKAQQCQVVATNDNGSTVECSNKENAEKEAILAYRDEVKKDTGNKSSVGLHEINAGAVCGHIDGSGREIMPMGPFNQQQMQNPNQALGR